MSSRTVYLCLCCLWAAAATFWLGCSPEQAPPSPPPRVSALPSPAQEPDPSDFSSTLPRVGGPRGYVGSAACQECHADQHASWQRSFHRTMTQIASSQSVRADFDNVVLSDDRARFTLSKRADEYWVRMEPLVRPPVESGPTPALEQRLGLVTGSHHMQVFWVPQGDGNLQLGFPFTWLIPEQRWVPRHSTFIRPPDLPHHSAEVWNVVCSRCHTTGVEPRVNFAARTAETQVAELGISCEACHGPGDRHVQAQKAAPNAPKTLSPGEIVHPKKLTAERSAQVCGFCHSMKWMDKTHDWRQDGFEFRPGDDLDQTTPVIRPSRIDAIAGLKDYLARNPELLRDFFWPDGMIRVSGREYNGLIESPCYQGGKFSCISCHSLHESDPDDQLSLRGRSNAACTQCHEKFATPAQLAAHTHHRSDSTGSECYNCHMPHTAYGILKAIRSHQISSPRVATDLATGRPNACNLCHVDQTLGWTAGHLAEWYQQASPAALPEIDTQLPYIARLALSGDAGQRALAAWNLGWTPAWQASATHGTNWIAPVLARLLDDPYSAVRCVAERSFRRVSNLPLGDYDFSLDPQARRPLHETLWESWEQSSSNRTNGAPPHLLIQNGRVDRELYRRVAGQRDDRPMRLRE